MNSIPGIPYTFHDAGLLRQALTHRSFGTPHYERLEFLGDGVLNLAVADYLFAHHPSAPEGDLSRLRSRVVRDSTLATVAQRLNLGGHLALGLGEKKSGGFLRESILADVVESIIGAIYLDGGFQEAHRVVQALLESELVSLPPAETLKDPKTQLQEHLQARSQPLPEYEVIDERGADHAKSFTVRCHVSTASGPTEATAPSRKKAEQQAADLMLGQLKAKP